MRVPCTAQACGQGGGGGGGGGGGSWSALGGHASFPCYGVLPAFLIVPGGVGARACGRASRVRHAVQARAARGRLAPRADGLGTRPGTQSRQAGGMQQRRVVCAHRSRSPCSRSFSMSRPSSARRRRRRAVLSTAGAPARPACRGGLRGRAARPCSARALPAGAAPRRPSPPARAVLRERRRLLPLRPPLPPRSPRRVVPVSVRTDH